MRHDIEVRWKARGGPPVRTLVNLTRLVTVVDDARGCKVHMQGYCLDVEDSFEDVCGMIEAAEAEGSRKPADRPLMGTAARERQGKASNSAIGQSWEEVQRELFTSEEIEESNRRVARIAARLKGKPGDE